MVCVGCARVSDRAQHFGGLAIAAHGMATIQVTAAWICSDYSPVSRRAAQSGTRCLIPSGGSQSNHTASVCVLVPVPLVIVMTLPATEQTPLGVITAGLVELVVARP